MLKRLPFLAALAIAGGLRGQTAAPEVEIANLREDVSGLSQKVSDLGLRVEQLEAQNAALRDQLKAATQNTATVSQLNSAVADLNRAIQAAASAATPAPAAEDAPRRADGDFPKEGLNYTVLPGDTLAMIAKKTGARISDIINANKIADPSRIIAGQALFIPGGK